MPEIEDDFVSKIMKLPFVKFVDLGGSCYAAIALVSLCMISSAQAVDMRSYNELVIPFLDKHCTDCHDDDEPKADLDLYAINERWLYIQTLSETDHKRVTFEELYDKDKDPAEMTNLLTSEERPAILKTLKAEIKQHRANVLER